LALIIQHGHGGLSAHVHTLYWVLGFEAGLRQVPAIPELRTLHEVTTNSTHPSFRSNFYFADEALSLAMILANITTGTFPAAHPKLESQMAGVGDRQSAHPCARTWRDLGLP
jgi:hypothetical protein